MSGKKLGAILLCCVLALGFLAGYLSLRDDTESKAYPGLEATDLATEPELVAADHAERMKSLTDTKLPYSMPDSLQGTDVDGGFRVDDQGHLIVDKSIKRFMDYFLGTVGELSIEQIVANLEALVQGGLEEPARTEAMTILRNYIDYKQALYQLEQDIGEVNVMTLQPDQLGSMGERLRQMRETRLSFLGEDVTQAFYGEEEAVDQYTLKKLLIVNDETLSEEDKRARLQQAESLLPPHIKEQRAATQLHAQLSETESRLKSEGATPEQLYAARAEMVGDEAAVRLAELDTEREDFRRRLRLYRVEKASLDATAMAQSDKAASLAQLRKSYFTELETRRVIALDKLGRE